MSNLSNSRERVRIYLIRKKKKTFTLSAIFFFLSLLALIGTIASETVNGSLKELREQFYACITIEQAGSDEDMVTPKMAEDILSVIEPDGWSGTNVCYLSMKDISLIPGKYTALGDDAMHIARLVACGDSRLTREFSMGTLKLTEGRALKPEDKGKVVISDTLAKANGLRPGDYISGIVTESEVIGAKAGIGTEYYLEIIGIFHVKEEQDNTSIERAECELLPNYLFVDEQTGFSFMEEIRQRPHYYSNGITVWMKDPAMLEGAVEIVETLDGYNWKEYAIHTNGAEYARSAGPLKQMKRIIGIMFMVILGMSGIFLIVLLALWNRERQREIGILLSLGFKKNTILFQIILENSILYIINWGCAVITTIVAAIIAGKLLQLKIAELQWLQIFIVGGGGWLICVLITWIAAILVVHKKPLELLSMVI